MLRIFKGKPMKRQKEFTFNTVTDIKIFLMFLLDNIDRPIDYTTISEILMENVESLTIDYEDCLRQLADEGHLYFEEIDGEKYYMISDQGRRASGELYDTLDKEFRERSIRYAIKHISLSESGARVNASVSESENGRYRVVLEAYNKTGQIMSTSILVSSRSEAEMIKQNFENKPDAIYRGILFSLTGRLEYIS